MYVKVGRFGPYVQRGQPDDEEKPKNASLLKGMTADQIDLATALASFFRCRAISATTRRTTARRRHNGRFGPYIKCGEETRSLPADISPLDVTLEQALELLAQPKAQRRGFGVKREPLKVFEPTPANTQKIELLDGRYGMYVTDGTTNASLPKNLSPEELTVEFAQRLLADRAAAGPSKKTSAPRPSRKVRSAKKPKPSKRPPSRRHAQKNRPKRSPAQ